MQAPDQTSLPKDSVKKTFALPYVSTEIDRKYCERLANDAMLELIHRNPGPVQLNVPMIDNELGKDVDVDLPNVKVIRRVQNRQNLKVNLNGKKILLVIGENCKADFGVVEKFAENHDIVIYANHLSNYYGKNAINANLLLSCISQEYFDRELCPDILISIGGQTGDYPLFHKLAESNVQYEHWRISTDGDVVDTYDHLTKVFECSNDDFFIANNERDTDPRTSYLDIWTQRLALLNDQIEVPLSNVYLAQNLTPVIPQNSIVNFAILNSLRTWNLFSFRNKVFCNSNVAAFGIDGCLSTFLGQSVVTDELCYLIVGDLSFFYDMNALGIKYIKNNVRIILVNNRGGVEFKLYFDAEKNKSTDRFIAASGHFKNARGWAETCNFEYIPIKTKDDFQTNRKLMTEASAKPILFEVFVSDLDDGFGYRTLINENKSAFEAKSKTIKSLAKNKIRSFFSAH